MFVEGEWVSADGEYTEAVTAAVGPLHRAGKAKTWLSGPRSNWEDMLRDFDRNGPSFLGFYLDLVSEYGSMVDLEMQDWVGGEWVTDESEDAADDLRGIKGVYGEDLNTIVARMIRLFDLPGEMAWIPIDVPIDPDDPDSPTEIRVMVRSTWTLEEKKVGGEKAFVIVDEPGAKPGSPGYRVIPQDQASRLWRPDQDYPMVHWTPLQRGISELRIHRNIQRTISRSAASKLLNADVFWFKGEARDLAVLPRNDGPGQNPGEGRRLGYLGVTIAKMIQSAKENLDDIREEKVAAAFPHPLVTPEKPERIEVGRPYDPEAIAAKRDAMEEFARGQNIPMSVLVEGQGAGARLLNNVKQDVAFMETAIFPKLARVCNALTGVWLRPMMEADGRGEQTENRRIWFSKQALEPAADPKLIQSAVAAGVLSRKALASVLNQTQNILELPEGMTEAEWFLAVRGGAIANEANKTRDGIDFNLAPTADDVREMIAEATEAQQASAWWEE